MEGGGGVEVGGGEWSWGREWEWEFEWQDRLLLFRPNLTKFIKVNLPKLIKVD